jgi:hypothetical protein
MLFIDDTLSGHTTPARTFHHMGSPGASTSPVDREDPILDNSKIDDGWPSSTVVRQGRVGQRS